MKTFEEFKASREKMDPSTRKMNQHQWEQAYDAYRRSRERVRSSGSSGASKSGESRRSRSASSSASAGSGGRGMHLPSTLSKSAKLRAQVRQESAYAELRALVNLLAWGAVGIIGIFLLIKLAFYTSSQAAIFAIGSGLLQITFALILKSMLQVLIDIPDIALFRAAHAHTPQGDAAQTEDVIED